ncbi:MAG: ATP-binding cassette domain-containing protein [Treponema sp.]
MNIYLRRITKRFALKTALDRVSLDFPERKIYAVLGENGAGKSTVASILSGDTQPTAGKIFIENKSVRFRNAGEATAAKIICVHQRPLLADSLTVFENIILGAERLGRHSSKAERAKAINDLVRAWAPALQLDSYIWQAGRSAHFFTAFICALLKNPSVLILDEPASLLDDEEKHAFYSKIRRFVHADGALKTVIIITHSPEDAASYADSVIVMKKGGVAKVFDAAKDFTPAEYRALLSEDENAPPYIFMAAEPLSVQPAKVESKNYIAFENVSASPQNRPAVSGVSIKAPYAAITCVKGEKASGLETLENVITGMANFPCRGTFEVMHENRKFTAKIGTRRFTPAVLRYKQKAAILSSDRNFRSADPRLTVEQLLTAMYQGSDCKSYAQSLIDKAGINIKPDEKVASLSGGMLQQLLLRRELESNPELIIMCEPLQGLDSNAAKKMCDLLTGSSRAGKAVLIIAAADFPDELCSKIYYLKEGKCELIK